MAKLYKNALTIANLFTCIAATDTNHTEKNDEKKELTHAIKPDGSGTTSLTFNITLPPMQQPSQQPPGPQPAGGTCPCHQHCNGTHIYVLKQYGWSPPLERPCLS